MAPQGPLRRQAICSAFSWGKGLGFVDGKGFWLKGLWVEGADPFRYRVGCRNVNDRCGQMLMLESGAPIPLAVEHVEQMAK